MANALISVNPEICGGAPCISGTRIMVSTILSQLAGGYNIEKKFLRVIHNSDVNRLLQQLNMLLRWFEMKK